MFNIYNILIKFLYIFKTIESTANTSASTNGTTSTVNNINSKSARSRKRQARKNQPQNTFKYGPPIPIFHPPTPKERELIIEHHCFLLRNLNKIRKLKERLSPCHPSTTCASPAPLNSRNTLSAQISALKVPRNMKTRGLASFGNDPELEKTAKIAVILCEICNEISSHKGKLNSLSLI